MQRRLRTAVLACAVALFGCGGGAEATETSDSTEPGATNVASGGEASGGETDPNVVPSPARPWADLSPDEKREWMVTEVMPRMSALFEEHDAERYAGFSCDGCHGEDAQARHFEMPNAGIMALHPTGSPEQQAMIRDNREMVVFMFQRVIPTMQTLLGEQPYDETTREGFSCFACHPRGGATEASLELPAM